MASDNDLAISPQVWGYKTGIENREKNLVVRVRTKGSGKLQALPEHPNGTGAGKAWSDKERQVTKVFSSELVVVVGELLPASAVDNLNSIAVKGVLVFDESKHRIIDTIDGTYIVVRPIHMARSCMYALHEKENDMCSIVALRAADEQRIVYYREWTDGILYTQRARRNDGFRTNLTQFCRQYLEENESKLLDNSFAPYKRRREQITDESDLEQKLKALFQRPGTFGHDEATALSSMIKEQWSNGLASPENSVSVLLKLSKGLSDGAHNNSPIASELHRHFVVLFGLHYCEKTHEKDEALQRLIDETHNTVVKQCGVIQRQRNAA
ncbi:hypothetical protein FZEAL_6231 [Fusarium zealandicum]|uniref:Uncharacterized protein n=1 Tax=Fusarium zealandicum TaxID=1053134 RepID=A0A8H4UJ91_9HYPO|nr:hypothetical protein FZEAL_6231 [Fusarium zealandicum]